MASNIRTRVTRLLVVPQGEPMYSEMATTVEVGDEVGGEFVVVSQVGRDDLGKITINPEEWPALRAAINRMVKACEPEVKR